MKKYFLQTLILLCLPFIAPSQLLYDNESKTLITKGLDKLYNFEFKEADGYFQKVKQKYPQHPVTPLLNALQLQWQNVPIESNAKALVPYLQNLEKCKSLAEKLREKPEYVPEATFFLLASYGYIALVDNYKRDYIKAANAARKAYGYVKDGFKLMDKNPEFYFSTGLYNYYVIQYPESHPIVKPLIVFFDAGNKKLGLQQLEIASQRSAFSRAEALWYLTASYLKYDHFPLKSLQYSRVLRNRYPNNYLYLMRFTEGLVFAGKYEEAKENIALLKKNNNQLYQLAVDTFEGIIAERSEKNDAEAAHAYTAAIKHPSSDFGDDYLAMAYAGLARIANRAGDKKRAKVLYDKALEYAEYTMTIKEAKGFK